MDLIPTEDDHISRLLLDRYATGELTDDEVAALEPRLTDAHRAYLATLAAHTPPPLDLGDVRDRAAVTPPAPANRPWQWVILAAVAAVALLVTVPLFIGDGQPTVRFRGALALAPYVQGPNGTLEPWDAQPVAAGDTLGFKLSTSTPQAGVVVLSVDGDGTVTRFWPETGNTPEPLSGHTDIPLPGTVVLDDARGPEVFVAVQGMRPAQATLEAKTRFAKGGRAALEAWGSEPEVAVVVMERR